MAHGRRPNAAYLPGQGMPGGKPINRGSSYSNLNNNLERYFYNHYYYQLWSFACNLFHWDNLPDGIPSKFIERTLIDFGYGCFGPYMGRKVFTKCTLSGPLDMYYEPKEITMYSVDEVHVTVKSADAVIVYNNYARLPTSPFLDTYAARMAKAEAFIAVNMNANKTPVILGMPDQKATLSIKNLYAKFEGNEPAVIQMDAFGQMPIQAIDTGAAWKVDKAQEYKRQTWDEAMLFLGLRTTPVEKRERVNVAETLGDLQQVELSRQIALNARQDACEKINELWGTNITVELSVLDDSNYLLGNVGGDTVGGDNAANGSSGDLQPEQPGGEPERNG